MCIFFYLRAFPAEAAGQLDVLGEDRDPLSVDGQQASILKIHFSFQTNKTIQQITSKSPTI
jgi:hypothetical protein